MALDTEQKQTDEQSVSTNVEKRNRQIMRSTVTVMFAFAATKVVSLAQTFIIAKQVGIGSEWDAFVTANRVPELIFILISGGALAHAFIPIFASYLAKDDKERAWKTASHVINTIFLATLIASTLVFFAAPLVARAVAPGFDAAGQQQTAEVMRILLVSTLIFSVSGISMGILQSHNHFLLPALAPIMFDIGILGGVVFLLKPLGVQGIAIGAVVGAVMHLGIQVPGLIHYKARWWPELGLTDPILWQVIRLMLPRVAGLGVFSLNFLVMNNIASQLGTGSVSALDWGWRLMQIPETLIGTAMGTVIFPTLAALSELGDETGKRRAMSGALRFVLIATIPAAVGLIFAGRPLISLLERGAFNASASALVYSTLQFFALGLVVHSALEVVARSFYADKDTITPLWAALGGAAINLVMSILLSGVQDVNALRVGIYAFDRTPLIGMTFLQSIEGGNVAGLALANSMGVAFEVLTLLWILRRRWQGVNEDTLTRTTLKTLAASAVMALFIVIVDSIWRTTGLTEQGLMFTIIHIGIAVGGGVLVFIGTATLLKMDELHALIRLVLRRQQPAEASL